MQKFCQHEMLKLCHFGGNFLEIFETAKIVHDSIRFFIRLLDGHAAPSISASHRRHVRGEGSGAQLPLHPGLREVQAGPEGPASDRFLER